MAFRKQVADYISDPSDLDVLDKAYSIVKPNYSKFDIEGPLGETKSSWSRPDSPKLTDIVDTSGNKGEIQTKQPPVEWVEDIDQRTLTPVKYPANKRTGFQVEGSNIIPRGLSAEQDLQQKAKELEQSEQIKSDSAIKQKQRERELGLSNEQIDIDEDALNFTADIYRATGQLPSLGMGAGGLRAKILETASRREKEAGGSAQNVIQTAAGTKAGVASLGQQQKMRGMMGSFVRNMDKQVSRVEDIGEDIVSRVGVRALDMPIRSLNQKFLGSGNENILEAYTTEISNEIAKLSTGSASSIAELSVGAQERWAKIHDPNLSYNELMKILNETKHMAQMRLDSADEEINATKSGIGVLKENSQGIDVKSLSDEELKKRLGL
jgi:hypothetical protein